MKNIVITLITISTLLMAGQQAAHAQINPSELDGRELNVITTAVPLLRVGLDARSGAMGELGLAISPDANSLYWNPSKLAMTEEQMAISLNYTPWLRQLAKDIYLVSASGYYKITDAQAIGAQIRYNWRVYQRFQAK